MQCLAIFKRTIANAGDRRWNLEVLCVGTCFDDGRLVFVVENRTFGRVARVGSVDIECCDGRATFKSIVADVGDRGWDANRLERGAVGKGPISNACGCGRKCQLA